MLTQVLRSVQRYERSHGVAPDVVYVNPRHWFALMRDCPGLRGCEAAVTRFGFHILVLPEEDLPHPRAARLPLRCERAARVFPAFSGEAAAPAAA